MPYDADYAKNYTLLKKCRRMYNILFFIYFFMCIPYAAASLLMMIMSVNGDILFLLFDGIIFKSLIFAAGFYGIYKKENIFAFIAPIIGVVNVITCGFDSPYLQGFFRFLDDFNLFFIFIPIIFSLINVKLNKQFHFLEEQAGFPYFNERFDDQNYESKQWNIKNPYQQRVDELQKTQSNEMESISFNESESD